MKIEVHWLSWIVSTANLWHQSMCQFGDQSVIAVLRMSLVGHRIFSWFDIQQPCVLMSRNMSVSVKSPNYQTSCFKNPLRFRVQIVGTWILTWFAHKKCLPLSEGARHCTVPCFDPRLMRGMTRGTLHQQWPSAHPTLTGGSSLEISSFGDWKRQTLGNPSWHKPWTISNSFKPLTILAAMYF